MSVVVAYSPTDQGRAALRAAVRHARSRDLPLVVASHSYPDPAGGRATADEPAVRRELAEADGEPQPRLTVLPSEEPDVGEFLLRVAESESARLLVIGLRGKSRIGKLNLGAAARRVLLGSPCPVLAVKCAGT